MKLWKPFVALFAATLLMTACASPSAAPSTEKPSAQSEPAETERKPLETEEIDAKHARALAEKILELVNKKDTEALHSESDEKMKKTLEGSNLEALYRQIDSYGTFQKINDTREAGVRTKEGELHIVVAMKAQYEKQEVQYTFAFNEDDVLISLILK